ncbi:MAG: cysteine--tRNA ligase [Candidatus Nomurabacteria bacterium]|nr:cysteine--tRNA ligase [Candidatus Nomurabacteria bacterium]
MALNDKKIKLYNTLSREKEDFLPMHLEEVRMYTCGPTVYNYPHIGNYRAYIFTDILKRYLKYSDYNVKHVMNITDVDDKTIRDSIAQKKSLKEFTEFYTLEFFKDRESLNIEQADIYTKATNHIEEMVQMIEILLDKGYAYKGDDGSIYFNIKKDPNYGKLSHFKLEDLKNNAQGRLKNDEYEKENAQDFALWKAWDANDGDVFWDTSLGKGRPGWHIECSAMSIKNLGETFDIHTGGVDLIFPHHENEIAQSECATGKKFVKYWLHNEHLMVNGKKMSKSAGNFYTLRDLIEKGINPIAFRYWLYTGHYRTKVNFTLESVKGAQIALERLIKAFMPLMDVTNGIINQEYKKEFIECMDDDLNTPKAIALLWQLIADVSVSDSEKKSTLLDFDKVFGFGLDKVKKLSDEIIPEQVLAIAEERKLARDNKEFRKSDELRAEINSLGYEVKDLPNGFKISKL